ncbi:DUF1848 domain-containing protein, partial [bacterium]|nr:DUF1848 domain-containing protein [bacterium]
EEKKRIISASRRSDIPAFYSDWFMDRIREGFCRYKNPFGGQILEVRLDPASCLGIVFWTRFPAPMFKHFQVLQNMGFKFYFQFTITGYPKIFETHNPTLDKILDSFKKLSDTISPDLVFWRYDPIILSSITDEGYHLEKFESLCKTLRGYTKRCYFSFADYYSKTRRNLFNLIEKDKITFYQPLLSKQSEISEKLWDIGTHYGFQLYSCCSPFLKGTKILKARCVDDEPFRQMGISSYPKLAPKPSRQGCGCIESTDIGTYNSCIFGCRYCYATKDRGYALGYYKKFGKPIEKNEI